MRKFRNKNTWTPTNQDAQVETYIKTVITDFQKLKLLNKLKQNLTLEEIQWLDLIKNKNLVVKPADKGSAVVIMDRTDYIKEATQQLSDTNFYTKMRMDLTGSHFSKITQTLTKMLRIDEIEMSVYRNLLPKDCKTPALYFLPKVHIINKQNITGRPIISGNNIPTEKISTFINERIKQSVQQIKSYVQDTPDFIKKIENFKHTGDDYFFVYVPVYQHPQSGRTGNGHTNTHTRKSKIPCIQLQSNYVVTTCFYTWTNSNLTEKITCKSEAPPWAPTCPLLRQYLHAKSWRIMTDQLRLHTTVSSSLHRQYLLYLLIQLERSHQIHDIHEQCASHNKIHSRTLPQWNILFGHYCQKTRQLTAHRLVHKTNIYTQLSALSKFTPETQTP